VLAESASRLLGQLRPEDQVLDVGGWASPFPRADWVLDLMPYESRGLYGYDHDSAEERFGPETWIVRDICDREPWPFEDRRFDFVVCSHTLEDVRDPVWVCSELIRVARAGYIEVPSRLEEQIRELQGPWVGRDHHRWLCDVHDDGIDFVCKSHRTNGSRDGSFPPELWSELSLSERVQVLWWADDFAYRERFILTSAEYDDYLREFVDRHRDRVPRERSIVRAGARRLRAALSR
jgi:hypothetical protein